MKNLVVFIFILLSHSFCLAQSSANAIIENLEQNYYYNRPDSRIKPGTYSVLLESEVPINSNDPVEYLKTYVEAVAHFSLKQEEIRQQGYYLNYEMISNLLNIKQLFQDAKNSNADANFRLAVLAYIGFFSSEHKSMENEGLTLMRNATALGHPIAPMYVADQLGNIEEKLMYYQLSLDRGNSRCRRFLFYTKVKQTLEKYKTSADKGDLNSMREVAFANYFLEEYETALSYFKKLSKKDRRYLTQIICEFKLNDGQYQKSFQKAAENLQGIQNKTPDDILSLYQCFYFQKKFDDAFAWLKLIEQRSDWKSFDYKIYDISLYYSFLGTCYQNGYGTKKNLDSAIYYFRLTIDSDYYSYKDLGDIYVEMNKKDSAETYYLKFSEIEPVEYIIEWLNNNAYENFRQHSIADMEFRDSYFQEFLSMAKRTDDLTVVIAGNAVNDYGINSYTINRFLAALKICNIKKLKTFYFTFGISRYSNYSPMFAEIMHLDNPKSRIYNYYMPTLKTVFSENPISLKRNDIE